jgi:hypothetical protein
MKKGVVVLALIAGAMALDSCSWWKDQRTKGEDTSLPEAGPTAAPTPRPKDRWWARWKIDKKKYSADKEIIFPDPALNRAVRLAIHRPPKGKLYQVDVMDLENLKVPGWNVRDISGLEHCGDLIKLDLSWNPGINDLSPLQGLAKLKELNLRNLNLSDLSPLAHLHSLEILDLANNRIQDLSPLQGLVNLTYLDLSFNRISDLSPLANMTRLTTLTLYKNQVQDLSPLAGLINLSELNLTYNNVVSLRPLLINSENKEGGLGQGDVVYIFGNPCCLCCDRDPAAKNEITALKKAKVEVRFEYAKYKEKEW